MINILLSTVLPVFFISAIGFAGARGGIFSLDNATSINRFVFFVSLPALLFRLVGQADFHLFDWRLVIGFVGAEVFVYGIGFSTSRIIFRRSMEESVLLGLASAFANHVLFILPVAVTLFGDSVALPLTAIIVIDSSILFGVTLVMMDTLTETRRSPRRLLIKYARNPQILAMVAGLAVSLGNVSFPQGLDLFLSFTGRAAAPCALFALGILLSQKQSSSSPALPIALTGIKLLVHPLLGWIAVVVLLGIDPHAARPAMMVAAGPSGISAFVLAVNYNVPVEAIIRTILYSSVLSVITVSMAAAY